MNKTVGSSPRAGRRFLAIIVALAFIIAACGGADTATDATEDGDSSGRILISGSSTVEPITARVAEAFADANPDLAISVEGPGTGDGFKKFCAGETDISNASRAIKEAEAEACAAEGIEFVGLEVGIDGLSVLTSPDNDTVECLSFADLYALTGPEATGFGSWDAANSLGSEVGGNGDYPAENLVITGPGEESGTYDTFVELVIEDIADERGQDAVTRPDYTSSPNDNVIVEGITGSPTSLGWVGFAFFAENQDVLKAIQVDDGETGCVAPTEETIADGTYPLSRSLYVYVNKGNAAENESLTAFMDFYLSDGFDNVTEAGYVALPADRAAATKSAWEDR